VSTALRLCSDAVKICLISSNVNLTDVNLAQDVSAELLTSYLFILGRCILSLNIKHNTVCKP
jgi:hypothetical protein